MHPQKVYIMRRTLMFQSIFNFFNLHFIHTMTNSKMMTLIIFLLSVVSQTIALALSSETDKFALLSLKEKLTNGVPDYLPSWNESLHFCEWEGVTCGHRRRRVTVLQLENQNFGGTIGPSLGNLTFLRKLKLVNLNLHGEIPRQVGRLKRLKVLMLKRNNIQGEIPMELSNCTNLQVIYLYMSELSGKIPLWFGSMRQLIQIAIGKNYLVGTIPPSLGNISSLQNLDFAQNQLEGNIPYTIGRLSKMYWLNLGGNNLSGVIPNSLYNLSYIQVFAIAENQLFGSLPSNIHLVFPNLQVFLIDINNITGTFPSSISNLTNLQMFDITMNGFSGSIPPTLGSLNKLRIFHISNNNFGSGSAHDLDFLSSLTNCSMLEELTLNDNRFGGVLPDLIGNFSIHLRLLSMSYNPIYGVIPERVGELVSLTNLYLMENSLGGTIPSSIGKLKNLGRLALTNNRLSGNIPTAIGNLTMLSELYLEDNQLEGSIPSSLKYCTQLQTFSISDNNLSGDIPNQTFVHLQRLVNLDLDINLFTGPLPSEFGNLKQLSILKLNENKLSGRIPEELGACLGLTELYLEGNSFNGGLLSFLKSLRSLEILDISNNNFSGIIPVDLENLTFLNTLNLSFNHLYGEVPTRGVFSNVTSISLIGNKGLCGGIPQLKLPACSELPSVNHKRSLPLVKKLILIIVIVGVVMSLVAFTSIYFLCRKPKKLPSSPALQNEHLRVTYGELHEATNGFSSSNLVGTGSFGSVYKGSLLHFESLVAIKVINLERYGAAKSFTVECNALRRMKHRNLLRILTCCSSVNYNGEDFKAIVFDFMSNGSLENLLHGSEQIGSRNVNISLKQRVNIALDVAHSLDYLHNDSEQALVHCDVKPSNVLLDDDFVAHLGDFGLARLILGVSDNFSNNQVNSSTIKGTIGYVPPEYGAGGALSPQGDIYSYGILLLEMLTGKRPTDSMFGESISLHKFCEMAIPEGILEIVDSHLLAPYVEDHIEVVQRNIKECLVSLMRIGVACSEELATHRMCMKDIIVKLNEIKKKLSS